jgi:hypothetical protein
VLNSHFKEANETQAIHIEGINPTAFKQFLRYVYTGSLEDLVNADNVELLLEIFVIAHLYDESLLQNHILELLDASLHLFSDNIYAKLSILLNNAAFYESEELIQIGFWLAEKVDNPSITKILSLQNQTQLHYLKKMAKELNAQRIFDLFQQIELDSSKRIENQEECLNSKTYL